MAIPESDIQPGWIYSTTRKQERLVLGRDRDGRIVYVSKGRNIAGPFLNCHVRITAKQFAKCATGKLRFIDDVKPYIIANKATTVVVGHSRGAVAWCRSTCWPGRRAGRRQGLTCSPSGARHGHARRRQPAARVRAA